MKQYVLGLNMGHDASCSIISSDGIEVAIHDERISRVKHGNKNLIALIRSEKNEMALMSNVIPWDCINYSLNCCNISLDEIRCIIATTMPFVRTDGYYYKISDSFKRAFSNNVNKTYLLNHHLAHASSSYYASPFEEAVIIVCDGAGSTVNGFGKANDYNHLIHGTISNYMIRETISLYHAYRNDIKCILKILSQPLLGYSNSLGFFYKEVSKFAMEFLKLDCRDPDGKLMALAGYGKLSRKYKNLFDKLITLRQNGIDINILKSINNKTVFQHALTELTVSESDVWDLAFTTQKMLEGCLLHLCNIAFKWDSNIKNLCLAGGTFLNSVANKVILDKGPFNKLFIQPATNDSGLALGCAYFGWNQILQMQERFKMDHAYFGKSYSTETIIKCLQNKGGIGTSSTYKLWQKQGESEVN